jgi:hypothetical protein
MTVYEEMGIYHYGILLSEKDSIVYPNALSPELRKLTDTKRVHRVPDYTGASKEERVERIGQMIGIAKDNGYDSIFAGYGFMAEDDEFVQAIEDADLMFIGPCAATQRAAGKKDEAKRTALTVDVSVTPGIDNVTARTLVKKHPSREALVALVKAEGLKVDKKYLDDKKLSLEELADKILNDPVTVQIGVIAPAKTVSHAFYPVPKKLKKNLLLATLKQTATGRVLIFTRTKYRARNLARDLEKRKYRVSALQGNMTQNRRQQAIDGFRNGKYDILVATDIAARGIDVSEISHVINFDMPDTVDAYTHRIGRTGRAHKTGEAFTFMAPGDEPMVRSIEKVLGKQIERRRLPGFNYGGFVPERQARENRPSPSPKKRSNRRSKHSYSRA